jgi:cytoskeleton protein RodZ
MGFGERMQREREMRSITLDEIAQATKIGVRALRALEEEAFDKLPGGIFNKGFVRAYARYLGIDDEQAVADYEKAAGISEPREGLDPENLKKLESAWKPEKQSILSSPVFRVPWAPILTLVLLVGVIFAAWHYRRPGIVSYQQWQARRHPQVQAQPAPPQNNSTTPTPAPTAAPQTPLQPAPVPSVVPESSAGAKNAATPVSGSASSRTVISSGTPAKSSSGARDEFVVSIHARQRSWVAIVADGKEVMNGVLGASHDTSIRAREAVTVTAGNAGGLEVSFNGHPQPALGASNEVRKVTFTSKGLQ